MNFLSMTWNNLKYPCPSLDSRTRVLMSLAALSINSLRSGMEREESSPAEEETKACTGGEESWTRSCLPKWKCVRDTGCQDMGSVLL